MKYVWLVLLDNEIEMRKYTTKNEAQAIAERFKMNHPDHDYTVKVARSKEFQRKHIKNMTHLKSIIRDNSMPVNVVMSKIKQWRAQ